jgi:hypothetical protein
MTKSAQTLASPRLGLGGIVSGHQKNGGIGPLLPHSQLDRNRVKSGEYSGLRSLLAVWRK